VIEESCEVIYKIPLGCYWTATAVKINFPGQRKRIGPGMIYVKSFMAYLQITIFMLLGCDGGGKSRINWDFIFAAAIDIIIVKIGTKINAIKLINSETPAILINNFFKIVNAGS
jgi:hypothetical protein